MTEPNDQRTAADAQIFNDILVTFIEPDIEARVQAGRATAPLDLRKFHIVMHLDGQRTEVRLNEEATIEALVELQDPSILEKLVPGEEYFGTEIPGRIYQIQLTAREDPDAGHIYAVSWTDGWHFTIDARYNRGKAAPLVAASREFLETAKEAYQGKRWRPFVDNMFSAMELAIKATLWTGLFGKGFEGKMPHGEIHESFSRYAKAGNVTPAQAKVFEELRNTRPGVRYAYSKDQPNWKAAERWIAEVDAMLEKADRLVADRRIAVPENDALKSQ